VNRKIFFALVLLAFPRIARADSTWVLAESTLTYHVSHPLKQTEGVSHAAKGKGVCHAGDCDFLIAVQVKSFDSGDSNRDLHMLQVVRGGQFPLITVRTHLPETASSLTTIQADLEVQFAGHTVQAVAVSACHARKRHDHHGHDPADALRFQDRSALTSRHSREERYSGSRRNEVAADVDVVAAAFRAGMCARSAGSSRR